MIKINVCRSIVTIFLSEATKLNALQRGISSPRWLMYLELVTLYRVYFAL